MVLLKVALVAGVQDGEVASMSNILEQEDYIKGLPDSELQRMVEQPNGQIPDFLPLSEIQRRTDMREKYAATEQPQMRSVRDNIMAQGLASAAPQRSSTPPDYLTSALPAGGGMQGQGGMGVQGYNTGGVIRMQEAGRVPRGNEGRKTPSSLKALRNGEAVVVARGENPAEYSVPDLEYIGRTSPNQLGFMSNFMGDNHEYLSFGSYVPSAENNTEPAPAVERPSTQEMIQRYETVDTMNIDPRNYSTSFEKAAEETESRYNDPEKYPYSHLSEFQKQALSPGQRNALIAREKITAAKDFTVPRVAAAGSEVADAVTAFTTGSTSDPEEQRSGFSEGLKGIYNEYLKPDFKGSDFYDDIEGVLPSVSEYDAESYYGTRSADSPDSSFYDEMMEYGGGIADMIGQTGSGIFNSFRVAPDDETPFERTERLNAEGMQTAGGVITESVTDKKSFIEDAGRGDASSADVSGGETGDRGVDSLLNFDSLMNPSENFDYLEDMQNRFGTEVQGGAYGVNPNQALQDEAYSELLAGQGDVSNNLRGLIDQTRADSKRQAFYLGMAALGAGIAKGDMGGGMQEAVNIASSTTARGQDAVAPLEAALVTQGTQGPKDRIEALASMARSDAAFQAVKADILRQGRLDQQSARTLRAATLQAVTRIVQESGGYLEDVDTPQQMADFIRTVAGQLNSEVESELPASTSRLTTNPETGRQRFTAP